MNFRNYSSVRMIKMGFYCISGGPWCPQDQSSLREDVAGVAWMLQVDKEGRPSCMHSSVGALWSLLETGLRDRWIS